jgi:peptidoglycan/xylan/chitin deacetylase (PgdA/CDA1 family)
MFEQRGLRAVFAVLANPEGFAPGHRVGSFDLWNELKQRGHHIQPHGYTHADLSLMPHDQAVQETAKCLDSFREPLRGFDESHAVWCCTYNRGTPALCAHLLTRVRAVRIGGSGFLSRDDLASGVWHSITFGPDDPSENLLHHVAECRRLRPPAFFYTLHGLDGEAWGAIARDTLQRVLDTLIEDPALEYWPLTGSR